MLSRLVSSLSLAAAIPAAAVGALVAQAPAAQQQPPRVDVWLPAGPVVRPGSSAEARFVADSGAYVTVFRLGVAGRVTVLYPVSPDIRVRNSRGIRGASDSGTPVVFRADVTPGTGFVFAAASYRPFDYSLYASRGRWNTTRFTSARADDPVAVAVSFVQRIAPRAPFALQYADYAVGSGQQQATVYRGSGSVYVGNGVPGDYPDPERHQGQSYPGAYYYPYGYYSPYGYGVHQQQYVQCPDGRVVLPGQSCTSVIYLGRTPVGTLPPAPSPRPASPRFRPPLPTPPVTLPPMSAQAPEGTYLVRPMTPRTPESTGAVRLADPVRYPEPGVIHVDAPRPAPAPAEPAAPSPVPVGTLPEQPRHPPAATGSSL